MRIFAISFLLLAMSLPVLADHDRYERDYRHRHRRVQMEERAPRYYRSRPMPSPLTHRYRALPREIGPSCEHLHPPPPLIVKPRFRFWIGF